MASAATKTLYELLRDSTDDPITVSLTTRDALCTLVERVEDFLRSEYPHGTGHKADAETDRLRRAFGAVR